MVVLCSRMANYYVFAATAIVFFCTYFVIRSDIPHTAFRHVVDASYSDGSSSPSDSVQFPLDDLMKGPVSLAQDDPRLIQRIRNKYLHPPSTEPYNLARPDKDDPSMGQSEQIRKILGEQKGGFFIECGALDGETRSNTLVFEKIYGWKGVIIEADPKNFGLIKTKNRKSWSVDACLSPDPYPKTVIFRQRFNIGKITNKEKTQLGHAEVQCLPLYSILLALNTTTVDYFSLDVEGFEYDVLTTIPWDLVNIKTLSIEFVHGETGKGKQEIRDYMTRKGYNVFSEVTHGGGLANDFIFVKNGIL